MPRQSAPPFQHFILTRFNLRIAGWQDTREKQRVLTDQWMQSRLRLFENYCYAALRGQRVQDFCWLVFFDNSTDERFRADIARLQKAFNNFVPLYIDGMAQFLPAIQRELQARLTRPFVITTRLDNDDCLHQDYIGHVQARFCQQDFQIIDLVDGYTLQIEPDARLGRRSQTNNPFQSLIERSTNPQTIWQRERHGQWSKEPNVRYLRQQRLWMSVIHGANKANEFAGFGNVDWAVLDNFNLPAPILQHLAASALPAPKWRWLSWRNAWRTRIKVRLKFLKRWLRSLTWRWPADKPPG